MHDKGKEEYRRNILHFLREELEGPRSKDEVLKVSPLSSYITGVLFPKGSEYSLVDSDEDEEYASEMREDNRGLSVEESPSEVNINTTLGTGDEPDQYEESIRLANSLRPAAMGLSFLCTPPDGEISVNVHAALYNKCSDSCHGWTREPLEIKPTCINLEQECSKRRITPIEIFQNLVIQGIVRRREDGKYLVTITLLNTNVGVPKPHNCFFQAGFSVGHPDGELIFHNYRIDNSAGISADDKEARSMELLYSQYPKYAIGHGCAADWKTRGDSDRAISIFTSNIPCREISPILPATAADERLRQTLSMEFLGCMDNSIDAILEQTPSSATIGNIISELEKLPYLYEDWIAKEHEKISSLSSESYIAAAKENLELCRIASERMKAGIKAIEESPEAAAAFVIMNRVMLMQQIHYSLSSSELHEPAKLENLKYKSDWENRRGFWRQFQIAFILINIPAFLSNVESAQEEREIADLLWFPTGGGKTEAYLGLAAFCILIRRIMNPKNSGCTVLMRYTLRLLTSQQFQRASSMICAAEYIRRRHPNKFGEDPISIGLWIGGKPKRRNEARKLLREFKRNSDNKGDAENPFQILNCPWCGTALDKRPMGYRLTAVRPKSVEFRCPNECCEFRKPSKDGHLPISIIDEEIYANPPTLLLGTVDKFANLPWRDECASLFGLRSSKGIDPPDLIIQDELHLISGPLGSMVGLYESIIDLLCSESGKRPKIVASTATIRRAEAQCKALYNRRKTYQFPPQALSIEDSFFAKSSVEEPGRIYAGILPSAASSPQTALRWVSGALLQAAKSALLPECLEESDRDPYWTLVQYFSSLRELGSAKTLAKSDIPEHIFYIANARSLNREETRSPQIVEEMTGRRTRGELNELLKHLGYGYYGGETQIHPIDILLATNMISVGVDIQRLGLMVMVGQPKTTSEYIQSTSRVGRSREAPGLIITLYNSAKSRDRSHYEDFIDYHQAFYSHVEPTSVTPFSVPAMDRALHAIIITAVRHLEDISSPKEFSPELDSVQRLREWLSERVKRIDRSHLETLLKKYDFIVGSWGKNKSAYDTGWGRQYMNDQQRPEDTPLMYPAGKKPDKRWGQVAYEVPQSLRSVDTDCICEIRSEYPIGSE